MKRVYSHRPLCKRAEGPCLFAATFSGPGMPNPVNSTFLCSQNLVHAIMYNYPTLLHTEITNFILHT